jgi:hypothetical protein
MWWWRQAVVSVWQTAVLVVVGVGLVAPAEGAVICRKKSGVLLQRETACKGKEVELPLSDLQGPEGAQGLPGEQGDQGIQGTQGPTGATGPIGPSSGRRVDGTPNAPIDNLGTTIATMSDIAPGAYVILGKMNLQLVSGTNAGQVECGMVAGSSADFVRTQIGSGAGQLAEVALALHLVHTFESTGSATISCTKSGSDGVISFFSAITAVAVGTVGN